MSTRLYTKRLSKRIRQYGISPTATNPTARPNMNVREDFFWWKLKLYHVQTPGQISTAYHPIFILSMHVGIVLNYMRDNINIEHKPEIYDTKTTYHMLKYKNYYRVSFTRKFEYNKWHIASIFKGV